MSHALIEKGKVKTYPYSFSRLRADNPDTSYPENPSDEVLASHNVHRVVHVDAPPASALSKNVVEAEPILVKGVWTRAWIEVDASSEEITARQKDAADGAARAAIRQDAFVAAFAAMTPAQIEDYVDANGANLAGLRAILKKSLKLQRLMARELV